jgi:hypothetical protein
MEQAQLNALNQFIVNAKRKTYVGGGVKLLPYRLGSKDLQFWEGDWAYHDSYFGESDFLGQELVYYQIKAVWGMNYYGRLLRPDLATAEQMGRMIMTSLSKMYEENRFLGGFEHVEGSLKYVDSSDGDVSAFTGTEFITLHDELVYRLIYHGGLIQT